MIERLGLIGCGLMGGSFALALKRAQRVKHVVGYSPSTATTERAQQLGVIDSVAASAQDAVAGADLVLLAVPVSATETSLSAARQTLKDGALIMDVGSTKRDVVHVAERLLGERLGQFVPAHPIAGKERAGVNHADADLYRGRQVILTPSAQTQPDQLARAHAVWTAIGSHVREMTAEAHDAAYAAVSHLPHVLAFALMNAIQGQAQAREFLSLAGPGFRDFTRIAASDPSVWRDILSTNREELLVQSRHFQRALQAFEQAIEHGDPVTLQSLIQRASDARAQWHLPSQPPKT